MMRVTVLTGGSTPERDVAFAGAGQVVRALRERCYSVNVVDTVEGALDDSAERRLLSPGVGRTPPTHEQLTSLLGYGPSQAEQFGPLDLLFPCLDVQYLLKSPYESFHLHSGLIS